MKIIRITILTTLIFMLSAAQSRDATAGHHCDEDAINGIWNVISEKMGSSHIKVDNEVVIEGQDGKFQVLFDDNEMIDSSNGPFTFYGNCRGNDWVLVGLVVIEDCVHQMTIVTTDAKDDSNKINNKKKAKGITIELSNGHADHGSCMIHLSKNGEHSKQKEVPEGMDLQVHPGSAHGADN